MDEYADPARTLALLDELQALGFSDRAFAIIHHFRKPENIANHRRYCGMLLEEEAFFRRNTNRLVQRRLEMLLRLYKAGGFTVHAPELFELLASAVMLEVPHDRQALSNQMD